MGKVPAKRLTDGRALLNIGCGTTMDWRWNNLDFSFYARLAHHPWLGRILRRCGIVSRDRYEKLLRIDPTIIVRDIRRRLPFSDCSLDLVYHSQVLEHLDRDAAAGMIRECHRVLK